MKRRRRDGAFFFFRRIIYYSITLALFVGAGKAYLLWLDDYGMLHPDVVAAVSVGYVDDLPLDGVLIWDEQLILAPKDGVLTYPSSLPRRVMKNEAVAALDGTAVKVNSVGYFVPALDGNEGSWVYSKLWPGISNFPPFRDAEFLDNGTRLNKGDPMGKFVPQPQDLRCIAYLSKTDSLMRDIKSGFIEIKEKPTDKPQKAAVRAYWDAGEKIKIYLTLPFFPPSMIMTRKFECSVLTGNGRGVSVPESAVILRDGKMGVLIVQGNITKFTEVEGFSTEGDNFFITKGVLAGTLVVLRADKVREGVVMLW